ncbi:MAG: toxin-activating lysine-acyltransferase [Hyphomicrobium sp.]|jgi:cytolysin-activating lysine-acyltransferase
MTDIRPTDNKPAHNTTGTPNSANGAGGASHGSSQGTGQDPSQVTGQPSSLKFDHPAPEGHARTVSQVLGEIVWLMSQSPLLKQMFISDLEWFAMTPILLQQFRLFYDKDKPIGVVLWANASDEVAERLAQGVARLRPQDWKSGDQLWIVEVIAPFGGGEEMVRDFKTRVFPEKEVRLLTTALDGKKSVGVV